MELCAFSMHQNHNPSAKVVELINTSIVGCNNEDLLVRVPCLSTKYSIDKLSMFTRCTPNMNTKGS